MEANQKQRGFGVFLTRDDAEQALNQLEAVGFSKDSLSILAKQMEPGDQIGDVKFNDRLPQQDAKINTSPAGDAMTHSTWGFLLLGLPSLAIPGVGLFLGMGSLAAAMVASVAGAGVEAAAASQLAKALTSLGIPESESGFYSDRLLQGNYLVIADGPQEQLAQVSQRFKAAGERHWSVYEVPSGQSLSNVG